MTAVGIKSDHMYTMSNTGILARAGFIHSPPKAKEEKGEIPRDSRPTLVRGRGHRVPQLPGYMLNLGFPKSVRAPLPISPDFPSLSYVTAISEYVVYPQPPARGSFCRGFSSAFS